MPGVLDISPDMLYIGFFCRVGEQMAFHDQVCSSGSGPLLTQTDGLLTAQS